jgi:hypothetical protein
MWLVCSIEKRALRSIGRALAATLSGFLAVSGEHAFAFRPFDGTDAAVADVGEFEVEFGPVGWRRQGSERTSVAPAITLNLGVIEGWEAVLEGQGETALHAAPARTRLVDDGVFLKGIIRDGVLQGKPGPSIATEFGVLLPGINDDAGIGGSLAGIVSYGLGPIIGHFTAESALTRQGNGEMFLGTIIEGPHDWTVRPVAEIEYDRVAGRSETFSVLAGAIWQVADNIALDFGVREGRMNNRGITEIRVGITYSLRLWRHDND